MKTVRAQSGPFAERPFYQLKEIEDICAQELRGVGLYPSSPSAVRIERFIEKRFNVSPDYDELPEGVLGFTRFGPKGVEAVIVAKSLAEDDSDVARRRAATTLAHEAGHGLLHAHLFALGVPHPKLFEGEVSNESPKILCRDENVPQNSSRPLYNRRWWEYQANQAIGALLLPRDLAIIAAQPFLVSTGRLEISVLPASKREQAVRSLSGVFDVNPIVARLRVDQLFPEESSAQLTL